MRYILTPGTTYKYKFYAIVNGKLSGVTSSFRTVYYTNRGNTEHIFIYNRRSRTHFTASGNNNPTKYEMVSIRIGRVLTQDMAEGSCQSTLFAGESPHMYILQITGGINSAE